MESMEEEGDIHLLLSLNSDLNLLLPQKPRAAGLMRQSQMSASWCTEQLEKDGEQVWRSKEQVASK